MPDTDRTELIDQLMRETDAGATTTPSVSVVVAAALLAALFPDLLAQAMQSATTTADRQFVAIAAAHLAGDHDRVEALARDHLLDHPSRPLLAWIVDRSRAHTDEPTNEQGTH
jgi:hypothetical protein